MKKFFISLVATLFTFAAQATEYVIDPNHTNVRFQIDHFATTTNHGGFYHLEGKVEFSPAEKRGVVDISIPIKNINSGSKSFDNHLKSADLFDEKKYPVMRFVSTKWNFEGDKVESIDGNLTLMGQTHPITLNATKFNCYQSPILKAKVCGGDFQTQLDRTQWGMNYQVKDGISKQVDLYIQVEAVKK